jgi:hypothetical protein
LRFALSSGPPTPPRPPARDRLTLDRYAPRMRELLDRTAVDLEPIYQHLAAIGYSPD